MIHAMRKRIIIVLVLIAPLIAHSQFVIRPGTTDFDYYRLLVLKNPDLNTGLNVVNFSRPIYDDSASWNLWERPLQKDKKFNLIDPNISFLYNTRLNRSVNDGAVWSGKGMNSSFSFGAKGEIPVGKKVALKYTFLPIVFFAQNQSFYIPDFTTTKSEYSYPFANKLDMVERYGDNSLAKFDLGQTDISLSYNRLGIGFSTQNMFWGPGYRNPVLVSQNAGGFPHIYLGSIEPFDTKIGKIEFRNYWGALKESDYFDDNQDNNRRYITGMTFAYQPNFVKGLTIGANRILYRSWEDKELRPSDAFTSVLKFDKTRDEDIGNGTLTNDLYDQMAYVNLTWRFHEVGFEVFTEYALNDFPGDIMSFARHPDRTAGLVFGFAKLIDLKKDRILRIMYESTKLGANQTRQIKPNFSQHPSYYIHFLVEQGYTQDGQIIGAGIGSASNTHLLQVNLYGPKGIIGLEVQRTRFNDDFAFSYFHANNLDYIAEYEINAGIYFSRRIDNFFLETHVHFTDRLNWFYQPDAHIVNFNLGLNLRYLISKKTKLIFY
jgi:hypothetical protein